MSNIVKYGSTSLLLLTVSPAWGQFPIFVPPQVSGASGFGVSPNAALAAQRAAAVSTLANNPYLFSPISPYSYANPFANMYGNSYDPYYDPYGTLYGAAAVIGSQANLMTSQQQSFLMRERVREARIANRRKALDEFLYEREKTPTPEDDRQRLVAEQVRRSSNDPTVSEIWSGRALNDLLADLRRPVLRTETTDPRNYPIPLTGDQLKRINLTAGSAGASVAILKRGFPLAFPTALGGVDFQTGRDRINTLAQKAVQQAASAGRVDANTVEKLSQEIDSMQQVLRKRATELSPSSYMQGRNFLSSLSDAARALSQKDVTDYFNGKYNLTAKTLPELVAQMNEHGLQFAPAVPGDEAAYNSLHKALSTYHAATRPSDH
jgi:hypothetical protein